MKKRIKVTQPKYSMGYMAMLIQKLMKDEIVFSSHYIGESYVVYVWTPESLSVFSEAQMLIRIQEFAMQLGIDPENVRWVLQDQRNQTALSGITSR